MGKVLSTVLRPIKTFNIENRAQRIISKEKPVPAPRYPTNMQEIQQALEAEPDLVEKLSKKNIDLDARLRDIFVTSQGSNEDVYAKQKQNPDRPLPQDRANPPNFDFGYKEPDDITYGKTTLRHVLQFLADHQVNPKEFTVEKIALDYKMKTEDIENIVKYFKTFEMYIPGNQNVPEQLFGPAQVRRKIEAMKNQIEQQESLEKIEETDATKKTS